MTDMTPKEIEDLISRLEDETKDVVQSGAAFTITRHDDAKEEAAKALRQLLAERQWRPIDTAPKDGTEILGWRKDCGTILVRWSCAVEFMTISEIEESGMDDEALHAMDWFAADFIQGCRIEGDEAPTHWLPLPSHTEGGDVRT